MKVNQTLPAGAAVVATPNGTNPPRRILVVDDDVVVRQLSTAVLIHHGFQVDAAEDGAAGLEALHAKQYDLLITDNNMPKVNGVELVKKLRADSMTLPIIMASGAIPEDVSGNPWLLDATLLKPFTTDELLRTVNKVLRAPEIPRKEIDSPPMAGLRPSTATSTVRRVQSVLP